MNVPSILVVDDNPDNFDVIETLLADRDYQLHYAANGYDAIAELDTFCPDVILLDVMMPEIDGLEVCRKIKATFQWQAIPIIMVTALNTKEDLARCIQAGADDFISKPVNAVELRARLNSMLRIKEQYDNIKTLFELQENTIDLLQNTLNELRGGLASSLPHELNTPLNGILGTIGLLAEDIDEMSSDEIHELLGLASQSAQRLEKFTRKYLIYLELELLTKQYNKHELSYTKVSTTFAEHVLKPQIEKVNRSSDIIIDVEDVEVAVSEQYLTWILNELLDNALKFSQSGTPIKIMGYLLAGMLHLYVSDCGRGMTLEQTSKIDAFMQFERKTYEQQGLGLGLKIVKKIIDIVGGQFYISSIYQQETKVHIVLPIKNLTLANL